MLNNLTNNCNTMTRSKIGSTLEEIRDFTINTAKKAADIIVEKRHTGKLNYTLKSRDQMVSIADKESEALIIQSIHSISPNDYILSEETAATPTDQIFSAPSWIIDPIDGTTNYLYDHKHLAVSIGYAEKGEVKVGVVHMPFTGETFTAIKGQGAFLNGERIQCSKDITYDQALIAFGRPKDPEEVENYIKVYREVLNNCFDMRRLAAASADISYIACGRLQGFFESVQPWDIAAACLIAKEAGAVVGHYLPLPEKLPVPLDIYSKGVVIAPPNIYPELKRITKEAFK